MEVIMEEVYVKEGGRYRKIGTRWEGFPVDGIWLVWDGTQNCLVKLEDVENLPNRDPWDYITLASYQSILADKILDLRSKVISAWDFAGELIKTIVDTRNGRKKGNKNK